MFTPNQEKAATELTRVVRNGGRIGLASWTPDGFIGQLFKIMGRHVPPPAGIKSPALWGTVARLEELFPGHQVKASKQIFNFRYKSPSHWLGIFKTYYGPTHRAFAALDATKQASAGGRSLGAARADESGRKRYPHRAERVSRGGDHKGLEAASLALNGRNSR
jgi:hypothetical protein